jgi:hypothetical protein
MTDEIPTAIQRPSLQPTLRSLSVRALISQNIAVENIGEKMFLQKAVNWGLFSRHFIALILKSFEFT